MSKIQARNDNNMLVPIGNSKLDHDALFAQNSLFNNNFQKAKEYYIRQHKRHKCMFAWHIKCKGKKTQFCNCGF